jgi:hypothetical protein
MLFKGTTSRSSIIAQRLLGGFLLLIITLIAAFLMRPAAKAACSETNSFGRIEAGFTISSSAAGDYVVWVQAKGNPGAVMATGVDNQTCISRTLNLNPDNWSWQAINPGNRYAIAPGVHTLHLSSYTAGITIQNAIVINNSCDPNLSTNLCATETAPTNAPPTINNLVTNASSPRAPASFTLTVTASDTTGAISKVELLNAVSQAVVGQMSPTGQANQYSITLSNYAAGSYSFVARAIDNANPALSSNSNSITLTVAPAATNTQPTVTLGISSSVITSQQSATLTASPRDIDGSIDRVEIYRTANTTPIATVRNNYSFTISNYTVGTYTFTAKAYDNNGAVATSNPVTLTVSQPQQTDTTAPSAPTTITSTLAYNWWTDCLPVHNCRITLNWSGAADNNSAGVKAYNIYRSLNGQTAVKLNTTPITTTTFTETNISKGNQYKYSIVAVDAAGNQSKPGTAPNQTINCWWVFCGLHNTP